MENNNNHLDSFALLNKVIETSEATIEHYIMLMSSREDIIRIDQKIDQSLINLNATFEKSFKFMEIEDQKRQNFLVSIPKSIEANLSNNANRQLEQFEKKSTLVKTVYYGMIAALFLSICTIIGNIVLAKQWYAESLRCKIEIRQQILDEIKNNGQSVYRMEDYKQLQYNTELMNQWMKKNPKDAERFLRVKDGYESR
ncbi:hypothetical protein OMO38_04990 [Chryseobacterium sp. 09-1422]|uniref:Uncharacterized protein n=1 Tax=Chryseobacterium kimseyorum TaxID=2984028 RepID=A0ABT3HVR0_9FLAO|nr:hypothetical protein [Chryseobacterium kimseyorum]MCW3167877.1 hypothetical protein [Chryseobacterium kimseyorum]